MGFSLGARSLRSLEGVHPDLVRVVKAAILRSTQDFTVVEGVRPVERMYENYGKGRTAAEVQALGVPARYAQPGVAKVTWLKNPLGSRHGIQGDGFGHAVDLAPFVDGAIDWNTEARFRAVSEAMLSAAAELRVPVVWGGSWGPSSRDMPHFEYVGAKI